MILHKDDKVSLVIAVGGTQHTIWHTASNGPNGGAGYDVEEDAELLHASKIDGKEREDIRCLQKGPPFSTERREPKAEATMIDMRFAFINFELSPTTDTGIPRIVEVPSNPNPNNNRTAMSDVFEEDNPRQAAADAYEFE